MRVDIEFQGERVELDVPEGRLVASWRGPTGAAGDDVRRLVVGALEEPRGFPPLRKAVVPGDRVVIACGADVPEPRPVLAAVCEVLTAAGVDAGSIAVLVEPGAGDAIARALPREVELVHHEPDDRPHLAYLATTSGERRVYLNRRLTDADIVVPVGRLAYDPVLGYQGPWSAIFPGMSDSESRRSSGSLTSDEPPDASHPRPSLTESAEVSWLLGSQFSIGLVAGVSGVVEAVAGLSSEVLGYGSRRVDETWGFRAESRAELVVAGIGRPGEPAGITDVARGLATATRLVQRGGKVVVLSRAEGPIGPAMRRLIDVDDPRAGPRALRGHETECDYLAACELARALAWADVYLLSALDEKDVDALSIIALARPEEAGRLAAVSGSCLVVSHADMTWATVASESD